MSDVLQEFQRLGVVTESQDLLTVEVATSSRADRGGRANPYVVDLIHVLRGRKNGMSRRMVIHFVLKRREQLGLSIPKRFEATVQHAYEWYCVDSDVFKARLVPTEEGLFCWPKGKHKGHWAIIAEPAERWLADFDRRQRK